MSDATALDDALEVVVRAAEAIGGEHRGMTEAFEDERRARDVFWRAMITAVAPSLPAINTDVVDVSGRAGHLPEWCGREAQHVQWRANPAVRVSEDYKWEYVVVAGQLLVPDAGGRVRWGACLARRPRHGAHDQPFDALLHAPRDLNARDSALLLAGRIRQSAGSSGMRDRRAEARGLADRLNAISVLLGAI